MIDDKNIPHVLNQNRPSLKEVEKRSIWNTVEASIPPAQPVLSPYSFSIFNKTYIMAPLALLLAVVLGGGATAYASDAAKPGDALYPVERLVENVQLGLTFSPEAKEELVQELTQERLEELREIIDEEVSVSPSNAQGSSATSTATSTVTTLDDLEIGATVFTDTTVVKLELGGKKFYFETDAQTQQEVIDEIIVHFPMLSEVLLDTTISGDFLTFQTSDRESRPNDRGIVSISPEGEERISTAVDALLSFLDHTEVDEDLKDITVASLIGEVDGVDTEVEAVRDEDTLRISDENNRVVITVDDEGNSTVEVRSENGHVKVEDHDGEVKVEKEKDKDDVVAASVATSTALAVTAVSYTDLTVITVAFGVDEFIFTTGATSTDEIIAAVQAEFPALTIDDIQAVLTSSVVDVASTPENRGEVVSSRDEDDDEGDEHEYEDEDEDDDDDRDNDDQKESDHQKKEDDQDDDENKESYKQEKDDDDYSSYARHEDDDEEEEDEDDD